MSSKYAIQWGPLLRMFLWSTYLRFWSGCRKGHHSKALEEAIHAHQPQWAPEWEGKNPLSNGKKFNDLDAKQRVCLFSLVVRRNHWLTDLVRYLLASNASVSHIMGLDLLRRRARYISRLLQDQPKK